MYMNNFRRFIIQIGLTLTLLVGNFTSPVFAQPAPLWVAIWADDTSVIFQTE